MLNLCEARLCNAKPHDDLIPPRRECSTPTGQIACVSLHRLHEHVGEEQDHLIQHGLSDKLLKRICMLCKASLSSLGCENVIILRTLETVLITGKNPSTRNHTLRPISFLLLRVPIFLAFRINASYKNGARGTTHRV